MQQKNHREPAILRRPQVQQRTGLSRSTLYQYIKDGEFPKSIALGPGGFQGSCRLKVKITPPDSS